MKKWLAAGLVSTVVSFSATPVEVHGQLSVKGNKVVDKDGNPAKLHGMSLFWSQWMGKYWNASVVDWLRTDWKASIVRAAMGVESGGYLENEASQEAMVRTVVEAAIRDGMYVLIDWHEENAVNHESQAIDFFQRMARDYGKHPNVVYEIYNEPVKQSWWEIKNYATHVARAIRAIDPKNVIVVGNPSWSAEVDKPAADPVPGTNIAYTLHFYAASHKQWLRDRADGAMNSGIALFATEWGTCESNGNGYLDYDETRAWLQWMDDRGISWANWSIADKDETCSALDGGANSSGGWNAGELHASGSFVRDEIRKRDAWYDDISTTIDTFAVPGTVDAGKPSKLDGPSLEADDQGGSHLAYIDDGTAAEWTLRIASDVRVQAKVQAAGSNPGGTIHWKLDGTEVGSSAVAGTGGWQTWTTQDGISFDARKGVHTLRLEFSGAGTGLFNLRSLDLQKSGVAIAPARPRPATGWTVSAGRMLLPGIPEGGAVLMDHSGRILSCSADLEGAQALDLRAVRGTAVVSIPSRGISFPITAGL